MAELAKKDMSASERFMLKVVNEFSTGVGEVALTKFQQRLAQNYFMAADTALKMAEEKRLKKRDKQDPLPVTWANVNMEKLARDVVALARIGLDPSQKNHINLVPFKNNNTNKYDMSFLEGYRGIELKSSKYGLSVPDHVVVELVYTTDIFKSIKKDANHKYEEYEFEITDDFNRGTVKGGFYYHVYSDNPTKNKLVTMSLAEILKRRPQYASTEFWGGEKDVWEKDPETGRNKKTGTVTVDGWFEKMCWKTVHRAAWSDITIDSQKIDSDYLRLKELESAAERAEVEREIEENANTQTIDASFRDLADEDQDVPVEPQAAGGAPF